MFETLFANKYQQDEALGFIKRKFITISSTGKL